MNIEETKAQIELGKDQLAVMVTQIEKGINLTIAMITQAQDNLAVLQQLHKQSISKFNSLIALEESIIEDLQKPKSG